jgi:hypothetical protein
MVKFFMVEATHLVLNLKFNVDVIYLWLIILSVIDVVSVDRETLFNLFSES